MIQKSILVFFLCFIVFFLLPSAYILVSYVYAQSPDTQKALENVRETVTTLAETNDKNEGDSLTLRVETFRKVIELAIAEAKDIKLKLLAADIDKENESFIVWKETMLQKLDETLAFYTQENENLETATSTNEISIKASAEAFKQQREEYYLPLNEQIRDFLLIGQEEKAIEITAKRLQKISDDIVKLKKSKIKNFSALSAFLEKAGTAIKKANTINKEARDLFETRYIQPLIEQKKIKDKEQETVTATTTEKTKETTTTAAIATSTTTAAATDIDTSTTTPPFFTSSIKDLVKNSLGYIRDAYQIFIEMSNLVRKLLQ